MNLKYTETTFVNNVKKVTEVEETFVVDEGTENKVVNIYPAVEFQKWQGFGGAFTDAAGYVYAQMKDEDKKTMIDSYFKKENLNYTLGRMHVDSCDFSVEMYEAMSDENDKELESFSLERTNKYILPLLNDVQKAIGKEIEIMISPWSPPTFMKTNGSRIQGGKLKPEYREMWAKYLCKYIIELRKAGTNVVRMSIQNEQAAVQPWDSCIYTAQDEKEFIRDFLYPELVKNNLQDVEIFLWDHNKERLFERACATIDDETDKMIAGLAFHWYSGDHFEALSLVTKKFPGKKLILSEACIEYSKFDKSKYLENAQKYAHDIIGNLNNGMTAFYDWNIVLDQTGGPNHVGNLCDAPYLYDVDKKEVLERNTLSYIWHFSHYLQTGAVRIGSTTYSENVEVTVFKNPDGEMIAVLLNRTEEEMPVCFRLNGKLCNITLSPNAIGTAVIK